MAATDTEEMVVTAQFRKQNPQKTPLAITAISANTIEERSQVSVAEVASHAPNVRLAPGSGAFGPSLQAHIRGVGQNDFSFALEPGVGMYVDDVYYSTLTGSLLDLMDLDRVEILRGPQGTLAGQNSIGGAIKLYSKVPQGDNTGYVQTTYGRFNRTELRAAGDFSLIKDKLFGRVAGVANHSDGYVTRYDYACSHPSAGVPSFQDSESCKLGTEGGKAYAATRAALRWLPTDRIDVNLTGDYTHDNSGPAPNTLLYVGTVPGPMGMPPAMAGLPAPMPMIDPMTMMPVIDPMTGMPVPGMLAPNLRFGGIPLGTSMGSQFISYSPYGSFALDSHKDPYRNYSTYTDQAPLDMTAPYSVPPVYRLNSGGASLKAVFELNDDFSITSISAYRAYNGDWSVDEGTPVNVYLLHNVVSHRQFTQELRLNGKILDLIDFTLGGFYLNRLSRYGGRISLRTARFIENDDIPAMTAAGFANAEWHIIAPLSLIAGVRYTHQEKTFEYGREVVQGAPALSPALMALNSVDGKFSGSRVDYRGALQYQVIPELMAYVQIATGFKGGGVNPRPFVADQAQPHNPETLTAYELGVKTDLFDKHLRMNLAGFFNQYKDITMNVTMCPNSMTPVPCIMPINAGSANVMGAELEAAVMPVRGASIEGSLSWLKFKYDEISPNGASSGITLSMTGPYVPMWEASLGARYEFDLGSAGALAPRLDLDFRDSYYTNPNNSSFSKIDSRALLNGRLVWISADDTWQIAFAVTNITNLLYYYNIRDDRGSSYTVQGQPAPPRAWTISVKRSFL